MKKKTNTRIANSFVNLKYLLTWYFYIEKKANRSPGFKKFCSEFATHVAKDPYGE